MLPQCLLCVCVVLSVDKHNICARLHIHKENKKESTYFKSQNCWQFLADLVGIFNVGFFVHILILSYCDAESEKHGEPRNQVPEEGFQK